MVQNQLLDYISSQMKLGVSRDAIKTALKAAGWPDGDIEDTLKKSDISKPVQSVQPPPIVQPKPTSPLPVGMSKVSEPQSIKVSDLISANPSGLASSPASVQNKNVLKPPLEKQPVMKQSMIPGDHHHMMLVAGIAGIAIAVALGALSTYLYFQNTGLATKVASLGGASSDIESRVATLNSEIQGLDASNTALAASLASVTADNAALKMNLSFVVAPPGTNASSSPETLSVSGTLSGGGKAAYVIKTSYGVSIYVQNSKDAKVDAILKPLLTSTSSVELTGTHVPGSQFITIIEVNGSAVQ